MHDTLSLEHVLGDRGPGITRAMAAGLDYLDSHSTQQLLARLGQPISEIPPFETVDKSLLQDSFGGSQSGPSDDLLAGRGLFYVTEQRKLYLDCTSGHYQMTWGYNHPELCDAIERASRAGVIWDNHSNIPQAPLKRLAQRLVDLANAPGEKDPLDTVLLGVCTGSVACAAALKIQLRVFERAHGGGSAPVLLVLGGNYHGTDMLPQFMRGMWTDLLRGVDVVALRPNDADQLEGCFRQYKTRIAGFWAEPVMMNCEAVAVEGPYLQLARRLCDEVGALMCIDEIQTGFWRPEIFDSRLLGVQPDLLVVGKGMTAGFHPLSAVLYKHRYDVLAQYDAISTNGSAAMPAFVALCSIEMIAHHAESIRRTAGLLQAGFKSLVEEFPGKLAGERGRGHLAGLKFHTVSAAIEFHKRLLQAGLWTRVHAYHEGHSTLLTKLGLLADETVAGFMIDEFRKLLRETNRM